MRFKSFTVKQGLLGLGAMMLGAGLSSAALAASNSQLSGFSPAQQQQIQKYVASSMHKYLLQHPEVIMQSVQQYQMKMQQQKQNKSKQTVISQIHNLVNDPMSPSVGPANAAVTVVEFFDYQCSACHAMYPIVHDIMKKNPKVRYVFKNFPIFGPASEFAARAAIAAVKQGKFLALHNKLFSSSKMEGKLTNKDVLAMAQQVGLNIKQLTKDMQSPAVVQEVKDNMKLAETIGLQGTPAFMFIPTAKGHNLSSMQLNAKVGFIPGGAPPQQMQALIDQAQP